jgi:hypothetical protein
MRDVNLMLGLRKSFDIQQPHLKYYDMTLLGFNDINGNLIKDDNEKPVSNVLINIARDPLKNSINKTGFAETNMISDPNGQIIYGNLPEGTYDLTIKPLSNLGDLFFLNGENQTITVNSDKIHYLPLVESYKVSGKISVIRDPNSSEGKISLEGIRIMATGENGEVYSVLTNSYGSFILNLPQAASYKVSIFNVFGEQFILERNEYDVHFTGNKNVNVNFRFIEQRREIRFREGEKFFDFNRQE